MAVVEEGRTIIRMRVGFKYGMCGIRRHKQVPGSV